jgi:hypothetical protein
MLMRWSCLERSDGMTIAKLPSKLHSNRSHPPSVIASSRSPELTILYAS